MGIQPPPPAIIRPRVKFVIITRHCSLRMHSASVIREDNSYYSAWAFFLVSEPEGGGGGAQSARPIDLKKY